MSDGFSAASSNSEALIGSMIPTPVIPAILTKANASDEYSHFFEVKLELFDGPIDLLLHLVKQNELPIEKLSLAQVADQYFECIESAAQFDLEVAGEYLVIAATLLSIKASVLLNEPVQLVEDELGNLSDPHEELLKKLKEAAIYKQGALQLAGRDLLGVDVFSAPGLLEQFDPPPVKYRQHDPILLGKAFKKLLDKAGQGKQAFTITIDSVTIVERMMKVIDQLKSAGGALPFFQLVPDLTSRSSIIGSFLALLELCKRQVIGLKQENCFQDIQIVLVSADVPGDEMSSEFDLPDQVVNS